MAPLLRVAAGALQNLAAQYLPLHKATSKLSYVASSLFVGLLEEGFCTAEDSPEEAVGGEGGTVKEAEGTVSPISPLDSVHACRITVYQSYDYSQEDRGQRDLQTSAPSAQFYLLGDALQP